VTLVENCVAKLLTENGPMSSHDLITVLSGAEDIKEVAARKRLQRSVEEGNVCRFFALDKRRSMYCTPMQKEEAINRVLDVLRILRPKLWRLKQVLENEKIMPLWEVARMVGAPSNSAPLLKALSELELLGISKRINFTYRNSSCELVISKKLKATGQDLEKILQDFCQKLQYEEDYIKIVKWWLEKNKLGKEFRESKSRLGPFDAIGNGFSPRFAFVLFCVNLRKVVKQPEMESFIERIHRFIAVMKKRKTPVHAFYVATDFDDCAWVLGRNKVKMIRSDYVPLYRVSRKQDGLMLFRPESSEKSLEYMLKTVGKIEDLRHLPEMRSFLLELCVYLALSTHGYSPEWRKKYYSFHNQLTEDPKGQVFTDVDVEATRDGSQLEIVLCECRNWNRLLKKDKLLDSVGKLDKIASYLINTKYVGQGRPIKIRVIIIASCSKEDREKAHSKATFDLEIIEKADFRLKYCMGIKALDSYKWIFD
jgi:hypothetical protein